MPDSEGPQRVFPGFSSPRYTQVPDPIFDELLPDLSNAELKVLLYIVRRTFGFGKDSDTISLKQLCSGITTRDGRRVDRGTGLSKTAVTNALLSLRRQGILIRTKNIDVERGNTPTTYRLRMAGEPLDAGEEPPETVPLEVSTLADKLVKRSGQGGVPPAEQALASQMDTGLSSAVDTQETEHQETERQQRPIEYSNGQKPKLIYSETRMALQPYIEDFAREFGDEAKMSSSLTRAVNLCERSGMDVDDFIDVMMAARAKTKEFSASIKRQAADGGVWGKKNKTPYFFAVLESMLGLRDSNLA